MDGEAMKMILDNAKNETYEIGGTQYSLKALHAIIPRLQEPIGISTLEGLMVFMESFTAEEELLISVDTFDQVSLMGLYLDEYQRRIEYASVSLIPTERFPFGKRMQQEEFLVNIRSRFLLTPDVEYLTKLTKGLTASLIHDGDDSGIAQSITMKKSVVSKAVEETRPILKLTPFRTFQEVEQPESEFLLRLYWVDGHLPELCLFETDGGLWKVAAIRNIKTWIVNYLKEKDVYPSLGIKII